METTNQTQTIMGIPYETYKKLSREYKRINPHSLTDIRPKRRRVVYSEVVFSTR